LSSFAPWRAKGIVNPGRCCNEGRTAAHHAMTAARFLTLSSSEARSR
jgi:hypothetical protein